jgi:hypothetical protein
MSFGDDTLNPEVGRTRFEHERTKLLVQTILSHPYQYEWTAQGLGMLRMYLAPHLRLHIWDMRPTAGLIVPDASPIHDHPWDLESYIVAGLMQQRRFKIVTSPFGVDPLYDPTKEYEILKYTTIECGKNAHCTSEPKIALVERGEIENIREGDQYTQVHDEIHESFPVSGTVTIVRRTFLEDTEHARAFWRGKNWVSAAPRPATNEEIDKVCGYALREHFGWQSYRFKTGGIVEVNNGNDDIRRLQAPSADGSL